MQRELDARSGLAHDVWQWIAPLCWALVFLGLFVRLLFANGFHSVYPIFSDAARCWLRSVDMYWPNHYVAGLDSYRYSPGIAAFFSAFAWMPDRAGSLGWLTINTLLLLFALRWWLRAALPSTFGPWQLAGASLLILSFAAGNLNNGQTNTIVTAMLLLAAVATCKERWNLVACCLVVATLLKVYPLAFGLLLALAYPRQLVPRLLIGLALGLVIPCLIKSPEYVSRQYQQWFALMRTDDRKFAALPLCYRDLWLLIRVFELPMSTTAYTLLQGAGALAAAGACFCGKLSGLGVREQVMLSLCMATVWMMLLGPATESSTYLLLAPTLVWIVFSARVGDGTRLELIFISTCLALFLCAHVSVWFPETVRRSAILFQPVATLVLGGVIVHRSFREISASRSRVSLVPSDPRYLVA